MLAAGRRPPREVRADATGLLGQPYASRRKAKEVPLLVIKGIPALTPLLLVIVRVIGRIFWESPLAER